MGLTEYLSNRRNAGSARRLRRQLVRMAGPREYLHRTRRFGRKFEEAYEPAVEDLATMGRLSGLSLDDYMRGYWMPQDGAAVPQGDVWAGGSAPRSVIGKARLSEEARQSALTEAGESQSRQVAAILGVPYVRKPIGMEVWGPILHEMLKSAAEYGIGQGISSTGAPGDMGFQTGQGGAGMNWTDILRQGQTQGWGNIDWGRMFSNMYGMNSTGARP